MRAPCILQPHWQSAMKAPRFLRFSLRALFVATTLVVAYIGLAQHRRSQILSSIDELENQGAAMGVGEGWVDWIWPQVPRAAGIVFHERASKHFRVGDRGARDYTKPDAIVEAKALEARLRDFGIHEIRYGVRDQQNCLTLIETADSLIVFK